MAQHFTHDELDDMLTRSIEESRNLTDWERNFLTDIRDQFDRSGYLSDKQVEILDRIYTEKVP